MGDAREIGGDGGTLGEEPTAEATVSPPGTDTLPAASGWTPAVDFVDCERTRANVLNALFGADPAPSRLLADRYELLGTLGTGGFGTVYRAHDLVRKTDVALKVLSARAADRIVRFKGEFRSLSDLVHPNLATLYDLHGDRGQWFFTMQLVEGVNFLEYVRSGHKTPDVAAVRHAFAQLVRGIAALHQQGKVHRDLKPSNVLVDRSGRVVILDFGLMIDVAAEHHTHRPWHSAGTPAYMAPEQAIGAAEFASDWFSAGVMLYEALTGRLPHPGHPVALLPEASLWGPPDPQTSAPQTPDDLARVCRSLLQLDPGSRPSVLRLLEFVGDTPAAPVPQGDAFVGRDGELMRLLAALEHLHAGRCVHGQSGIGKSTLVRRAREQIATMAPEALIVSGRCYEQESVPYKALDGVIDALSYALAQVPEARVASLIPQNVAALVRVFPSLGQVAAIRRACRNADAWAAPDSRQARTQAALALRQLCSRIALRRPLVLLIDDLQWGDEDSAAILGELLRGPEPPPLLLVLSYRSESRTTNGALRHLFESLGGNGVVIVDIGLTPLAPADARQLVARQLATHGVTQRPRDVEAIVAESGGHPMFIHELVRDVTTGGTGRRRAVPRLDDVVWQRLCRLPEATRRLVEVVCLAGRPIDEGRACRAAALLDGRGDALARLRAEHFVRVDIDGSVPTIEAYHDRVRETVSGRLSEVKRRRHHARLADEYTGTPPDHEALALHLRAAGEHLRAAHHARIAGTRALESLAFEPAVALLRQALDEGNHQPDDRRELMSLLAGALADAGRGRESAQMYLRAAAGSSAEQACELRRRAAVQLLRAGHIERAHSLLREVLENLGESTPGSGLTALVRVQWHKARLRQDFAAVLRRRTYKTRAITHHDRARLEIFWSLATTLGMVDTVRGSAFCARHLRLALAVGDRRHTALGFLADSTFTALPGYRARTRSARIFERARELAQALDDPYLHGFIHLTQGMNSLLTGDYAGAYRACERAEECFSEHCNGVAWELATTRSTLGTGLLYTGQWKRLSTWLPRILEEADGRGDRYARAIVETQLWFATLLSRDQVDAARTHASSALRHWPNRNFQLPTFFNLTSRVEIELYAGNAAAAHKLLDDNWKPFRRSLLMRTEINRLQALLLRARCGLAQAALTRGPARAPHLVTAIRDIDNVTKARTPWAVAYAHALRGLVAIAKGQHDIGAQALALSEQQLSTVDLKLYALAARHQRGVLLGGEEGRKLVATAAEEMATQGVVAPGKLANAFVPLVV